MAAMERLNVITIRAGGCNVGGHAHEAWFWRPRLSPEPWHPAGLCFHWVQQNFPPPKPLATIPSDDVSL